MEYLPHEGRMGRAIYYCVQCSTRVLDAELEEGKAFRIGERILCGACAPEGLKTPSSKRMSLSSKLRTPSLPPAAPDGAVSSSDTRRALRRLKAPALLWGAGGILVLGALGLLLLRHRTDRPSQAPGSSDNAPSGAAGPVPHPQPGPAASADARERSAREDLEQARTLARARPEDLAGRLKAFIDLQWKWEGTAAARDAAAEAAQAKTEILRQVDAWMAGLEKEIKELVDARQFEAAIRKVESRKSDHALEQWKLATERRVSELYRDLARSREEAARKVDPAAPTTNEAPGADPFVAPEGRAYLAAFDSAAVRATAGDFAGAAAALERTARDLPPSSPLGAEAASDLALVRAVETARSRCLNLLRARPRGGRISLAVRGGSGAMRKVRGIVQAIRPERVEIRTRTAIELVDWTQVGARSLAAQARRGAFPDRVLAAMCLLDGDREAAQMYPADLASRWTSYGEGAAARVPGRIPEDQGARELFAGAEHEYLSVDTRSAAIEKYRRLRTEYGSTPLVKSESERIFRRSAAGREYYVRPVDFRTGGSIQPGKTGKLESTRDSDERETLLNFAEFDFAALPGEAYRCWVRIGACCEETFSCYVQGSEFVDTEPRSRKKISCEPGSSFAVALRPSVRGLKKTHEEHRARGVKVHPKTAARWEWVEIGLPKYAGPGAKRIRLLTNQAGFSVAGALVSSSRRAPPPEAEIPELEKACALDEPGLPVDPGLVGWWGFDEGKGEQTADLSGHGHPARLPPGVRWGESPSGGALELSAGTAGGEVEDAEDLRIPGNLTVAVWLRRTGPTADWVCVLGRGTFELRNYGLWLEQSTHKWMFQQYGSAPHFNFSLVGKSLIRDGEWTHLAATVDQDLARVYYNGALDGEARRPGRSSAGAGPLGVGYAIGHSAVVGAIGDARIYSRALSAEEIRALYEQGP